MEKALIIQSVAIFIFLWGIAAVFLLFRPKIEFFWKLAAILIFLFYIWFFYDEIAKGLSAVKADWYVQAVTFLKELLVLLFLSLFALWPVFLFVIFYKSDDIAAENILKFMCVFTVVVWIIFVVYVFYDKKIDAFLYQKLRDMVPFAS